MKKFRTALALLASAGALAAALGLMAAPLYHQKQKQDEAVLDKAVEQNFAAAAQSEKMQQSELAMSLYQNKQHLLLAGEPELQKDYTQPDKSFAELMNTLPPAYAQIVQGTPVPPMDAEKMKDDVIMAGTRLCCPTYGMHDTDFDNWYYTSWNEETGSLVKLEGQQALPLQGSEELIEALKEHKIAGRMAQQYLQLLQLDPNEFSAPEPQSAFERMVISEYSDYLDDCLLYSKTYELYVHCTLRASSDSEGVYLEESLGICSLTPEELRKTVM